MDNRDRLNDILAGYESGTPAQRRLHAECEHFRDLDTEDGPAHPDLAGALPDAERHADENDDRAVLKAARMAQIAAGYLQPIPIEEVASSQSIGRKRSWFKIGGVAYDSRLAWDAWLCRAGAECVRSV